MMTTSAKASERDRDYWERHALDYDASLRVLSRPLPRMLELTAQAVRGASDVLEVAAGTGLVTTAIAADVGRLTATDYTAAMVNVLRERTRQLGLSNVTCEQADIYALPYAPGSFDVVISATVSRVLALTGFPGHRRFSGSSLRSALEKHGVRVQHHEVLGGLIPVCYVEGASA
jgi:phosphatidylethanolamine/phosphatidyl-N-methylethanolamine N-methyltransferase